MRPSSALYRSIMAQPEGIRRALDLTEAEASTIGARLAGARHVFLTGTGTNSHAAMVGEFLLLRAGVEAYATTNFDFVTYPRPLREDDAVIVLSHTGTTQYGRRAVERARAVGAYSIGITGDGSPMQGPDEVLRVAPKEESDTYTLSYTATLASLAALAVAAGQEKGEAMDDIEASLEAMPETVQALLDRREQLVPVAKLAVQRGRMVLVGGGPNFATAREGALKVKESSYLVAEGFELETFLHGGLQAVERGDLGIVIVADGPASGRAMDVVAALRRVGAEVLAIADERVAPDAAVAEGVLSFPFPATPEVLSPLPATVPLQLLAAFAAEVRGTNPDNFRFDDVEYKAAIESLTL